MFQKSKFFVFLISAKVYRRKDTFKWYIAQDWKILSNVD